MTYAIKCRASGLYFEGGELLRKSITLSMVESRAAKYDDQEFARAIAKMLRAVFGSHDWQPVQVAA
jgi:hypothetical protein